MRRVGGVRNDRSAARGRAGTAPPVPPPSWGRGCGATRTTPPGPPSATRHAGRVGRTAPRARLDRLLPATLRPMIGNLLDALDEVHAGTLDPRQASAMASLAGAIVRAYSVGVLEDRVAALEGTAGGGTTA